jgi:hypothetical protein
MLQIDHLVLAAPDLAQAIAHVEALLCASATPGGKHPDFGTQNALVSLGETAYLEIIGPDPARDGTALPAIFSIDKLEAPRLVTWAVRTNAIDRLLPKAKEAGLELGRVSVGSRRTPEGTLLKWRLTDPLADRFDGIAPFFIAWGETAHPAASLLHACRLQDLTLQHPQADAVSRALAAIGLDVAVAAGAVPALSATVATPAGTVVLQ